MAGKRLYSVRAVIKVMIKDELAKDTNSYVAYRLAGLYLSLLDSDTRSKFYDSNSSVARTLSEAFKGNEESNCFFLGCRDNVKGNCNFIGEMKSCPVELILKELLMELVKEGRLESDKAKFWYER